MPKQIFQRPAAVPRNTGQARSGKGFGQPDFGRKKGKPPAPAKPAPAKGDETKPDPQA